MRKELIIKTRSLAGSSDLTLLAPIKTGLVPSPESVTYKTRVKRVLKTLNAGRTSSQEYALFRAFSDAVERVGKIHSVRVAVVEPDKLLLSVTFDGGFESYLRTLWQKVGTLLDVIFCNTEGYVGAWDHSYDEWVTWVRQVQIETDFFYGTPGLTVEDVQYLRNNELSYRRGPGGDSADLRATRLAVQSAEQLTWSTVDSGDLYVIKELGRQGLRALVLIHRLTNFYLPASHDGVILHRAARDLLYEFVHLDELHELGAVLKEGKKRFAEQILWFRGTIDPQLSPVPLGPRFPPIPQLPKVAPRPDDETDVQGGILRPYPTEMAHGCLLLIAFGNRNAAANFVDALEGTITRADNLPKNGGPAVNVAFTCEGLRAIGLPESKVALFPQEFREGMEARASLLGDLRTNHPRRWHLPGRNWKRPDGASTLAVELSDVHMVIQLRVADGPASLGEMLEADDPLFAGVELLLKDHPDIELLSVQPMVRHFNDKKKPMEHFGFADGDGQPVFDPKQNGQVYDRNQVQLGEFLLGYANEAEAPRDPAEMPDPALERERRNWLHNGSFLVVRKLSQDVKTLDAVVRNASECTKLCEDLIRAKMMGRWPNGEALTALPGKDINDFDYSTEKPPGSLCPLHAHIRRANPRQKDDPSLPPLAGGRTPRLMRRSMSYGPLYRDDPEKPRGLVFMAYNASIAEQFEVVQRWISGGNSAGGFSGQSDPFFGVPQSGQQRIFRFEHQDVVHRIALDGSEDPLWEDRPFVRLEWGAYLFTPSISALKRLARIGRDRAGAPDEPAWSESDGLRRIEELRALERAQGAEKAADEWKAVLEDPEAHTSFESAGVWAAIRKEFGGVLRTPYGVIVADRDLVKRVLQNEGRLYSVAGYHQRMVQSIGEIYLGLDDHGEGCPYREQATPINEEIGRIGKKDAFTHTRDAADRVLTKLIDDEITIARDCDESRWELNLDVKEMVDGTLEALCQHWFGLPVDPCEIQAGGARWDWKLGDPPLYPGHFTAPSRYFFQPRPGQTVEAFGVRYGDALKLAFGRLVTRHRDALAGGGKGVLDPEARLTKAILDAFPRRKEMDDPDRDDLAARTMVGAMMGFLPTVDGNLRLSLNELLRDGSFWSLRMALADCDLDTSFEKALDLLEPQLKKAMQLRPSPELVWRTTVRPHEIGGEQVRPGDKIVVAIVSATQQCLESGDPDVSLIFGGNRRPPRHPTHACPGYDAAMGVLLGFLTALLRVKGSMRPSVAPLALTLEGEVPLEEQTGMEDARAARDRQMRMRGVLGVGSLEKQVDTAIMALTQRIGDGHTLVAAGDSWFCWKKKAIFGAEQNIAAYLEEHGFVVHREKAIARVGTWLFDFYDDDRGKRLLPCTKVEAQSARIDFLCEKIKAMVEKGPVPTAILFSAAGVDVVEERLTALFDPNSTEPHPLDNDKVSYLVDGMTKGTGPGLMRCWLEAILDRLKRECVIKDGVPIPVFLHGYDYPVADCRWAFGKTSEDNAWLYPSFNTMKYPGEPGAYPTDSVPVMSTLITRLNDMQAAVAGLDRFKDHVFHINLVGTLSNGDPKWKTDWDNELHPGETGFRALTQEFVTEMTKKIPELQARSQHLGLSQVP